MKIVQLLPSAAFGDAIGNNALAIQNILRDAGYETAVYARDIDKRLPPRAVLPFSRLPRLGKQDILLYHMGIGSDLNDQLPDLGGRLVIQYHNITPPKFFLPYDFNSYSSCAWGRRQLLSMARMPQRCIAVSEYNKQDLLEAGFTCPIDVCPILIPFEDYQQAPSQAVLDRYNDGWTNLIFVGRIAPHKHQEDVIRAFAWYKKHLNPKSRLFLVGSGNIDRYTKRLHDYIDLLGVKDVIFPGHIKFNEILAYYKLADVFLCMSEHEGFCVPLAEAMCFRVPIVARAAAAVPDTLDGSGVLLPDNDPVRAALAVDRLVRDPALREEVLASQDRRLQDFQYPVIRDQLLQILRDFINTPVESY